MGSFAINDLIGLRAILPVIASELAAFSFIREAYATLRLRARPAMHAYMIACERSDSHVKHLYRRASDLLGLESTHWIWSVTAVAARDGLRGRGSRPRRHQR